MKIYEEAAMQHQVKHLHVCDCFGAGWLARMNAEIETMKEELGKIKPPDLSTRELFVEHLNLHQVIDRMRAKAEKHKYFGFGSLEAMNAFLEALPNKVSPETLQAIQALKPRETAESYTVFMKIRNKIYLGESAPSSKGANGEEGEGVWITATGKGKEKRINANVYISKTGSAEALFQELDPEGKLNFIRASKAMLPYFKEHGLYGSQVVVEWLSDSAASGRAWDGYARSAYPDVSDVSYADERGGVRALRDVTDECS